MQRLTTALVVPVLLVLLVVAGVAPTAVGEQARGSAAAEPRAGTPDAASNQTHAGTHVSFAVGERAVTDYAVHGETVLDALRVASEDNGTDSVTGDADSSDATDANRSPSAVTGVEGARLAVGATTGTETRVRARNGATVAAHDNRQGVLVVASGEGADYAVADLPAGANASAESDSQVDVTTRNGTAATLLVVGEGTVAVDDAGNVTARLGDGGRLVLRAYPEGKDDADETREDLLADGAAAAEVYVQADGDGTVVDTVSYDRNTTVEAVEAGPGEVALAADRTTGEGTVLLASVSAAALNASGGVEVAVDGEAAAEAVTYSQLESAVGSDQSRYLAERSGGDGANATDIAVGVNQLDGRTVSLAATGATADGSAADESADDESTTAGETIPADETDTDGSTADGSGTTAEGSAAGDDPGTTVEESETPDDDSPGVPGFTPVTATIALAVGLLVLARFARRQ